MKQRRSMRRIIWPPNTPETKVKRPSTLLWTCRGRMWSPDWPALLRPWNYRQYPGKYAPRRT